MPPWEEEEQKEGSLSHTRKGGDFESGEKQMEAAAAAVGDGGGGGGGGEEGDEVAGEEGSSKFLKLMEAAGVDEDEGILDGEGVVKPLAAGTGRGGGVEGEDGGMQSASGDLLKRPEAGADEECSGHASDGEPTRAGLAAATGGGGGGEEQDTLEMKKRTSDDAVKRADAGADGHASDGEPTRSGLAAATGRGGGGEEQDMVEIKKRTSDDAVKMLAGGIGCGEEDETVLVDDGAGEMHDEVAAEDVKGEGAMGASALIWPIIEQVHELQHHTAEHGDGPGSRSMGMAVVHDLESEYSARMKELAEREIMLARKHKEATAKMLHVEQEMARLAEREAKIRHIEEETAKVAAQKLQSLQDEIERAQKELRLESEKIDRGYKELNARASRLQDREEGLNAKESALKQEEKRLTEDSRKIQSAYFVAKLGRIVGMDKMRRLIGEDELLLPLAEPPNEDQSFWNRRHAFYTVIFMLFLPYVFGLHAVFSKLHPAPSNLEQIWIFYLSSYIWAFAGIGGLLGMFSKQPRILALSTHVGRLAFLAFCLLQVVALWYVVPAGKSSNVNACVLCGIILTGHICSFAEGYCECC